MVKNYAIYISALLLFATVGVIGANISLTPVQIVLTRTFFGFITIAGVFLLMRQKLHIFQYKKDTLMVLLSGIFMGLNWICLFQGYARIGVSITILSCYCGPVLVMLLSPLLFKEKLTPAKIAGFAVVFIGVILLNGKIAVSGGDLLGVLACILAAVTYAFLVICNKFSTHIVGLENSVVQLFSSFATVLICALIQGQAHFAVPSGEWPYILLLGIVVTGVGCFLYFLGINRLPIQSVSVCGYIEPLCSVIFAAVLLGERMAIAQVLGGGMVLGGAIFTEIKRTH